MKIEGDVQEIKTFLDILVHRVECAALVVEDKNREPDSDRIPGENAKFCVVSYHRRRMLWFSQCDDFNEPLPCGNTISQNITCPRCSRRWAVEIGHAHRIIKP